MQLEIDTAGELVGGNAEDRRRFNDASVEYNATTEPVLILPVTTAQTSVLSWLRGTALPKPIRR